MKVFLVLIVLFTISIFSALCHERNLERFTENPEDLERIAHPHLYWYMYSLRKPNPSLHYQNMQARNADNRNLLIYDHNMRRFENPLDRLVTFTYQSHPSDNNSRYTLKHKARKNRNHKNFPRTLYKSEGRVSSINKRNEISIHHPIHQKNSKNSKRMIDDSSVRELRKVNITTADIFNYTTKSWVKGEKREVAKVKKSNVSVGKRLYHSLSSFNLLFLLGFFLIFTIVASLNLVIVPATSCCWNSCKKRKEANTAIELNLKEVTVESALLNESNAKRETKTKPLEDMYDKFVSNEFDGEGDTVAKKMKLERWMTQDSSSQKKSRPGNHRKFNHADMESVSELSESDFENPVQNYSSQNESEVSKQHQDNIPITVERYGLNKIKTGKQKSKENTRVSRIESQPFNVRPNKLDTVRTAYNAGPQNPRHMYPGIHGKINHADLASVSEESLDSASSFKNPILCDSSQEESEESKQHQDDIPITIKRYERNKMKTGKQKSKENMRVSRNESQPFSVPPNELVTVRKADNGAPKIPCHNCSLSVHLTGFPKKAFYSMVDVNPYRFSRR